MDYHQFFLAHSGNTDMCTRYKNVFDFELLQFISAHHFDILRMKQKNRFNYQDEPIYHESGDSDEIGSSERTSERNEKEGSGSRSEIGSSSETQKDGSGSEPESGSSNETLKGGSDSDSVNSDAKDSNKGSNSDQSNTAENYVTDDFDPENVDARDYYTDDFEPENSDAEGDVAGNYVTEDNDASADHFDASDEEQLSEDERTELLRLSQRPPT